MFLSTVVLDARQTITDAVTRIAGIPDGAYVVVRRRDELDVYFYVYRAWFVRLMADRVPDGPVIDVLNLHESGASPTIRPGEPLPTCGRPVVVIDGDATWGILVDEDTSGSRGGLMVRPETLLLPGPGRPAGANRGYVIDGGAAADDAPEPSAGAPDPKTDDATADTKIPFKAYPHLDCPDQVEVGQAFDLEVYLTSQESPRTAGGPVTLDTALPEFDLVVSVVATSFTAQRTRDVIHVTRSSLESDVVTFSLTAEPIEGLVHPAILQVDFSFGGLLCGRAWRPIVVTTAGTQAPAGPARQPEVTSTPVLVMESERPPDLVITITENDDSTQLEWTFSTRHSGVSLPTGQVRKRFRAHNAKSFAMEQVRLIHESIGAAAIGNRMLGVARTIANQIPPEAWQVLTEVWRKTLGEQPPRPPSVLLVSTDAFVPWELASTEPDYVSEDLLDTSAPPFLGAQTCISRWNAPQPRGATGVLKPPLPPPESVEVRKVALVIGDYLALNGVRPLPKALEEGNTLAGLYQAIQLTATLEDIDPLFDGTLQQDGKRVVPDLVHFACHGQVDQNPRFNGIVLNEGNVRLDALYVAGNRMQRPFVFVNACQVGQATQLLDDAGGLATSFLSTGASGFVAPLWNVDDQVAQDTALDFYKAALDNGMTVAEILRRRRAMFDPDAASPQPTHLAYVYYGHPNLVLTRVS